MCLWGLTKHYQEVFFVLKILSFFNILFKRANNTDMPHVGILKAPFVLDNTICSGHYYFNNSGTKMITLSSSNIIKSMLI